ncbi:MAG TPA: V-type ATP synthase subunit A [Actinophytocola sp.]|jgi:V/A-type H+-transporting ATPase subunit A|uniref:V-type ATP synthase subunit A n=1 Tax=Actinophytocola sp. TaxID=1872138 RepID=UPI002F93C5E5
MTSTPRGEITRVAGPLVEIVHAGDVAMSDVVLLGTDELPSEIVAIRDGSVTVQAYEYTGGLAPGDAAVPCGHPLSANLGPGLLGGVFDGLLRPLSDAPTWLAAGTAGRPAKGTARLWPFEPSVSAGERVKSGAVLGVVTGTGPLAHRLLAPPGVGGVVDEIVAAGRYRADDHVATVAGVPVAMTTSWPVRRPRPASARIETAEPLHTGQRVLDLLFPIARGSTAAVPGGFGTGKTVLLQQIAKWCDADVIVYVGCGERGNELAEIVGELFELTDPHTGGRLADRTVVIANTSNMPMMAREASIYTGVTVAEYYRDMGYHCVVMADSTSRWAEALREFSSRSGELPAEEGYPAGLASALAAFYERAGVVTTLGGGTGSVTIIGAVSPPGGDLTEPVTAHTERFVRCRWTLDRDLAYARHYPAVSWSASFSRDAEALTAHFRHGDADGADPDWPVRRGRMVGLLAAADRLAALAELVGVTALPSHERMTVLGGRLLREAVLQQSALSTSDAFCSPEKGAALIDAVLDVVDGCERATAAGTPPGEIERLDFGPLIRAREQAGPHDVDGVRTHRDDMLALLATLEGERR